MKRLLYCVIYISKVSLKPSYIKHTKSSEIVCAIKELLVYLKKYYP